MRTFLKMYESCEAVRTSRRDYVAKKLSSDSTFYYVEHGFFDVKLEPLLVFAAVHALYFVTVYRVIVYGLYSALIFGLLFTAFAVIGTVCGCHKLWAHRCYKATTPFKVFLAIGHSTTGVMSVYDWAAGHRLHHKFSDTDVDPTNAKRGLWFAHCGWLFVKQHPAFDEHQRKFDFYDLETDPVVTFERRHHTILYVLVGLVFPGFVTYCVFDISPLDAFLISGLIKTLVIFHANSLLNSAMHTFGQREYLPNTWPGDMPALMAFAMGEANHNYHHAFPWDYASSEDMVTFNFGKYVVDLAALLGLAYDRKHATDKMLSCRREKNASNSSRPLMINNNYETSSVEPLKAN